MPEWCTILNERRVHGSETLCAGHVNLSTNTDGLASGDIFHFYERAVWKRIILKKFLLTTTTIMIRRAPVKRFVPYGQWGGGRIPLAIGNSPLLQNLHFDPMNLTIRQRRVVTSARLTGDRTPSKRQ